MSKSTVAFDTPELIVVKRKRVSCDGGGGALGHPKVYYDMGDEDHVDCAYCDRRFVYQPGPDAPDNH